jgi:hypothetical protein
MRYIQEATYNLSGPILPKWICRDMEEDMGISQTLTFHGKCVDIVWLAGYKETKKD